MNNNHVKNSINAMFTFVREMRATEKFTFNAQVLVNVCEFLASLPPGLPCPEFSVEPDIDGYRDLGMDWPASKTRSVSVSIGESPRVPYAWLCDDESGHGVDELGSDALADNIARLVSSMNTQK